jgi:hypothetical protein
MTPGKRDDMQKRSSPASGSAVVDGLDLHMAEYLVKLARAGYAETTQQDKRRALVAFIRWARAGEYTLADLDEACVAAFLARPSVRRRKGKHGDSGRAALHQFIEHLRVVGVVPSPLPPEPSPADVLVGRYVDHLRDDRGLHRRWLGKWG